MGLNNGILTKPISISEISQCLGVASQDLGTLCISGQINMWAKYKPVRRPSYSELTEEQRRGVGYGTDATHIDVSSTSGRKQACDNAIAGDTGWYHDKPTDNTGAGNQYRILDFNGYNHNAVGPFFFENAYIANTVEAKIRIGQRAGLPQGNMAVTDITSITGNDITAGYGFILKRGTVYTHVDAINDAGTGVKYPISDSHEIVLTTVQGTYDVCAYIRDYSTGNAVLVPVPTLRITVTAPLADVKITASLTQQSASKSKFTFTITGQKSTGVSAGTATLRIYNSAGGQLGLYNYDIPFLANGASYSPQFPETIEIPYSDIARWTFSYSGVEVSGTT